MSTFSPPRWIWFVYVALFGASVPWYLPDGPLRIWFGLPYWVVISVLAIASVSVFTLFVVQRYWRDDDEESPERGRSMEPPR
jgi:hypothetical protein